MRYSLEDTVYNLKRINDNSNDGQEWQSVPNHNVNGILIQGQVLLVTNDTSVSPACLAQCNTSVTEERCVTAVS